MPYARVRPSSRGLAVVAAGLAFSVVGPVHPASAAAKVRSYGPGAQLTADSNAETVRTTLAVPPGRRAVTLSTFIDPRRSGVGSLELLAGSTVVKRVAARRGRVSVRLPGSSGDLSLGLRYRTAGTCRATSEQVSLAGTRVTLAGTTQRPTSVATFFDDGVSKVTVVLPDDADDRVAAAALATVGAMAHRYGAETPVTLLAESMARGRALDDGLAPRVIRLQQGGGRNATARVTSGSGVPTLLLEGPADALAQSGAALGDERLGLADGPNVDDLTAAKIAAPSPRRTLTSLGREAIALGGRRAAEAQIGVRQADFGGPIKELKVQLVGTHSAVPPGTNATVDVLWDGRLVDSALLSGTDPSYRRTVSIPAHRLEPDGLLLVRVRSTGTNGRCAGALPVELDLDGGASVITGVRGPSVVSGFRRFPQVLGSSIPIVLGTGVPRNAVVRSAAALVTSLQRQSTDQLALSVTSLSKFREQGLSGLVVGATLKDSTDLDSPFRLTRFRTIRASAVSFGVGSDRPYAAMTAFSEGGRDVLLLGGWAPEGTPPERLAALQVALARRTLSTAGGWEALTLDLAVLGDADGETAELVNRDVVPQSERTDEYQDQVIWPFVVIALIVLAGVAQVLLTRRRRRLVGEHVAAQERADRTDGSGGGA